MKTNYSKHIILKRQTTTKNSLSRAGFELATGISSESNRDDSTIVLENAQCFRSISERSSLTLQSSSEHIRSGIRSRIFGFPATVFCVSTTRKTYTVSKHIPGVGVDQPCMIVIQCTIKIYSFIKPILSNILYIYK